MWPNPLRLVSLDRGGEGKAGGQPTQQDTNPPPEHKNPELGSAEILETPMPEKPTVEEAEKMPTPSEHIPVRLLCTCLLPAQVNRHTIRKNPNPHLQNRPILQMSTIIRRTPTILPTLEARGIDGTGRPPEFASRLLFHAPSSSIRGSPGSFAAFFVPDNFVGYNMVQVFSSFVSFLYLYAGISHLDIHLHIHGILVFFNFFRPGLFGSFFLLEICWFSGGLIFRSFLFGFTSVSPLFSIDCAFCCVMPQFCFSFGSSRSRLFHCSFLSGFWVKD